MKNSPSYPQLHVLLVSFGLGSVHAAEAVITDPAKTSTGVVTGGDAGEGLDLEGNFVYALAVGGEPGESWQVRGALFQGVVTDEVPGVTIGATHRNPNWYISNYGDSANDDNLEFASSSIRWSQAPATLP